MKLFKINQNKSERRLRLIISIFMIPAYFVLEQNNYTMLITIVGFILLFNSIVGTYFTYRLFGANTCNKDFN